MNAVTKETIATSPSADSKPRAFLRSVFGDRFVPHYSKVTLRDWILPESAEGETIVFKNVVLEECTLFSDSPLTFINCSLKNCRIYCSTLTLEATQCFGGKLTYESLSAQGSSITGGLVTRWWGYGRSPDASVFSRCLFWEWNPHTLNSPDFLEGWMAQKPNITTHGLLGQEDAEWAANYPNRVQSFPRGALKALCRELLPLKQWTWAQIDGGTPFLFPGDTLDATVKLLDIPWPAIVVGLTVHLLAISSSQTSSKTSYCEQRHLAWLLFHLGGSDKDLWYLSTNSTEVEMYVAEAQHFLDTGRYWGD